MKTFEIKKEHMMLLKNMYVSWWDCEFGAPAIDPKRPYGNSGVYYDIAEILGILTSGEDDEFTDEQFNVMDKLHHEMDTVLQIVLSNLEETNYLGFWECDDYSINWHKN